MCDWWSVGIILYEMLFGRPPFITDNNQNTQTQVINWKKYLTIPNRSYTAKPHDSYETRIVSQEAIDLISKLCCDPEDRLGTQAGASDIKMHPFFNGVNFRNIRKQPAPLEAIPQIAHPEDTSNFDTEEFGNMDSDDDENNDYNDGGNGQKQFGSS